MSTTNSGLSLLEISRGQQDDGELGVLLALQVPWIAAGGGTGGAASSILLHDPSLTTLQPALPAAVDTLAAACADLCGPVMSAV